MSIISHSGRNIQKKSTDLLSSVLGLFKNYFFSGVTSSSANLRIVDIIIS